MKAELLLLKPSVAAERSHVALVARDQVTRYVTPEEFDQWRIAGEVSGRRALVFHGQIPWGV